MIVQINSNAFLTLMMSACGNNSESTVSEAITEEESAKVTAETSSAVETIDITTSVTTENLSETNADFKRESYFILYEPGVRDGVPEVCNYNDIKARCRTDMAEKYTSWRDDYEAMLIDTDKYSDAADFAELYFGYSFEASDPVASYIEDDFDFDGNTEYYLCMAQYATRPLEDDYGIYYNIAVVTSVYYIDDDGSAKNALSDLVHVSTADQIYANSSKEALNYFQAHSDENNLKFQIACGYGSFLTPIIIDNGDSKHLFWKRNNDYPSDRGAHILWHDKSCWVDVSAPSASLGGFYEWDDTADELFFQELKKFADHFSLNEINLATKLDLYTYPEINGKVNTVKWGGEHYVYNIINDHGGYAPQSGPIEWH